MVRIQCDKNSYTLIPPDSFMFVKNRRRNYMQEQECKIIRTIDKPTCLVEASCCLELAEVWCYLEVKLLNLLFMIQPDWQPTVWIK